MYSQSVPALISKNVGSSLTNYKTWGGIIYSVLEYKALGNGTTDDTAKIMDAVNAAAAKGGIVFFPANTYRISTNFTAPANVTLWFANGAKLSIDTGITVTINGYLDAGLYQVFSGSGTAFVGKVDKVYPQWFGAKGDGVTDDTVAIQKALTTGKDIYLPRGVYRVTQTLLLNGGSGTRFSGEGSYSLFAPPDVAFGTVIMSEVPLGQATVKVPDGCQHMEVSRMTIKRLQSTDVGNTGLYFEGNSNLCTIRDVEISGHFVGLWLGSTGFSNVVNVYSHDNHAYGVYMKNSSTNGSLQWQLDNVLSQTNNNWGFYIESAPNAYGFVTMGNMTRLNTFANTNGGIYFGGRSDTSINGIRVKDSFFGQDGGDEIYIDSYGSSTHIVQNTFVEAAGTDPTGINQGTAAPNAGNGMKITANTYSVMVGNCTFISNSYNGIESSCQQLVVTGCEVRLNGHAAVSGAQIGIEVSAGQALITGNKCMGQQFGVYLQNDGYHMVTQNRLSQNSVQPVAAAVAIPNSVITPNITAG